MDVREADLRAAIKRGADAINSECRGLGAPASIDGGALATLICAARAQLPRTKMIDQWHVEYVCNGVLGIVPRPTLREAEYTALNARTMGDQCVRVTGPHQHLVPDDGAPANPATDRHSK